MCLWYSKDSGFELIAYSDVDHAGCNDDCKSTSGGIQFLRDKLVSWPSKKQDCTSMSTAEAEVFLALLNARSLGKYYLIIHSDSVDVPVVYLQQFLRTVSKVPGPGEMIKFMLNTQDTEDVCVRGMLISDAFLTEEIRATDDFKKYETVFMNVDVLMNQLQPVVSTQGTHRSTPSAHRTPTLTASPQGKKRKQSARELSSPHKSLKITIRQQKVVERDHDDDDYEDRLEPESHKDNPEHVDDDDDKDEEKVHKEEGDKMGSLETMNEETQTTIPTLPISPRTILSSDKNITHELTDIEVLKRKFEKSSTSNTSCRDDDIHSQRYDDHQEDDAPPEGEKRVKTHKASKRSKSTRGSPSKHLAKDSTTYVSKQQQQREWDAWVEKRVIDEDEVIPKDETPELITELHDVD
nr:uncharacterized mitochondrial protein AtMg00810-like [Tanacetum cinerariifolium]GEZ13612.1 uncharacterized mitochondrial protein AtMg00810-like [Tanacetum cinerariifolium]